MFITHPKDKHGELLLGNQGDVATYEDFFPFITSLLGRHTQTLGFVRSIF